MIAFLCAVPFCRAQLNDYKYIIVPKKFSAFKNMNEHQTSTLIKFLLEKEGFDVVYDDDTNEDLEDDYCLGAKVNLEDNSGLFATKVKLMLRDCSGKLLFETQEGRSKIKEFKKAYHEAIREACLSFKGLEYAYEPKEDEPEKTSEPITISFKDDVKQIETETQTPQIPEEVEVVEAVMEKDEVTVPVTVSEETADDVLYAQATPNGYQLVDSSPKIVYVLRATSSPEIFMVTKDGKSGIVFKKEGKWYLELDGVKGKPETLNIKF